MQPRPNLKLKSPRSSNYLILITSGSDLLLNADLKINDC